MKTILLLVFFVTVGGFYSSYAFADLAAMKARVPDLVKAKEAGLIGEQQDGLVGLVNGAKADAQLLKLIADENEDRLQIYKTRSTEQSQAINVFMKVMGEARIESEKKGRFFQSTDGSWKKK